MSFLRHLPKLDSVGKEEVSFQEVLGVFWNETCSSMTVIIVYYQSWAPWALFNKKNWNNACWQQVFIEIWGKRYYSIHEFGCTQLLPRYIIFEPMHWKVINCSHFISSASGRVCIRKNTACSQYYLATLRIISRKDVLVSPLTHYLVAMKTLCDFPHSRKDCMTFTGCIEDIQNRNKFFDHEVTDKSLSSFPQITRRKAPQPYWQCSSSTVSSDKKWALASWWSSHGNAEMIRWF